MPARFTLVHWNHNGWCIGIPKGVPEVFSQGETLEELEDNIRDVYELMCADTNDAIPEDAWTTLVGIGA